MAVVGIFKRTLNLFGRRSGHGQMAIRSRIDDLAEIITAKFPVIVDGGASKGAMIDLFLKKIPSATIHAFEPISGLVQHLQAKYESNEKVTIHPQALGAVNNRVAFNIVKNSVSSSILKPSNINRAYHGAQMDIVKSVDVDQVRLDGILDQDIDILKLDLQGYELDALKGCEKLLPKIKVITTEVEFVPLYEGQSLFADIDIYLRTRGFRLLNLYELWTHPDGQLTAGDAIYLNKNFF